MARHLVTIQKIKSLTPIPNADKIELAEFNQVAWKCVVKKGDFKVNEHCVYFEVDSFLPIKPEFEFLRKNCFKKTDFGEGFRIKTIRLKGQISQGLALTITDSFGDRTIDVCKYEEGQDITELLGVKIYSPPIPAELKGIMKGAFPSFIAKTDETRVQVLQDVLTRHKGTRCYVTEKIDGTSVTYYLKEGIFGVCSRNLELLESEGNAYWRIAREFEIETKLKLLGINIAIQGEIHGTGLQGNPLKLDKKTIRFFNAFDIDKFRFYDFKEFRHLMNVVLNLPTVPIITEDFALSDNIDYLVKFATRKSEITATSWMEGIVIRPLLETFDMQMAQGFGNGRVSFKAINPEYLLESDN